MIAKTILLPIKMQWVVGMKWLTTPAQDLKLFLILESGAMNKKTSTKWP